jgi:hypothetical protein
MRRLAFGDVLRGIVRLALASSATQAAGVVSSTVPLGVHPIE